MIHRPCPWPALSLVCCALGALAGCEGAESDAVPEAPVCRLPVEAAIDIPGHLAGYRGLEHQYELPWSGVSRSIFLNLYYPTTQSEGASPSYLDLFADPQSFTDASYEESDEGCLRPLVVYSHGARAWGGSGAPVLRQFVAAGWVAVAPDHAGNTMLEAELPDPFAFHAIRAHDVLAAIDFVEQLPETDPLYGRVDTSQVLVVGHSFGGQTAWLLTGLEFDSEAIASRCVILGTGPEGCTLEEHRVYAAPIADPRVVGAVALAGSVGEDFVEASGFAAATVPVLFLTGTDDFDGAPRFHRAAQADVTWVELSGACHESFTGAPLPCASLEKDEGLTLTASYAVAFGRLLLLPSEAEAEQALLLGERSISERVALRRSRP